MLDEVLKPVSERQRLFSWWRTGADPDRALLEARQILPPIDSLVGAARRVASSNLPWSHSGKGKGEHEAWLLSDHLHTAEVSG
jgi:hypothetical protein